jgi:hypothetical protein
MVDRAFVKLSIEDAFTASQFLAGLVPTISSSSDASYPAPEVTSTEGKLFFLLLIFLPPD